MGEFLTSRDLTAVGFGSTKVEAKPTKFAINFWDPKAEDQLLSEQVLIALGGESSVDLDTWLHLPSEGRVLARAIGEALISGPFSDVNLTGDIPLMRNDLRLVRSDVYYKRVFGVGNPSLLQIGEYSGSSISQHDKIEIGDPPQSILPEFYVIYGGLAFDFRASLARARGLNSSWSSILSPEFDDLFNIQINGRVYDTRSGMTRKAYSSLVYNYIAQGDKPPNGGFDYYGHPITRTWLTGEPELTPTSALAAYASHGRPLFVSEDMTRKGFDMRFRPAVRIPIGSVNLK